MKKRSAPTLASVTLRQRALRSKYNLSVAFDDEAAATKMNEFDAIKWGNWVAQRKVLVAQTERESPVLKISRFLYRGRVSKLKNHEARGLLAA